MDLEEAILQMNMIGHTFFVFANSLSERVNVVYKREDGRYGLIEPN
jgi:putative sigma-54 modulation protein